MQVTASPRLGDILVEQGTISAEQLLEALHLQTSTRQRLGNILLQNEWATEEQITMARAVQMDVPYINASTSVPNPAAVALVPAELAFRCMLLPMSLQTGDSSDQRLILAMADPWDVEAIDLVQRAARRRVQPKLASESTLLAALERTYRASQQDSQQAALDQSVVDAVGQNNTADDFLVAVDVSESQINGDQAPVIRFVHTIISDAIRKRASDIHLEPRENDFQVRYRIDGQLQFVRSAPRTFLAPTVSRIKIMAEMDIAERRLPLDGRISMRMDGRSVDMRVSSLPTRYGERLVMRILDRASAFLSLDDLGFSPRNRLLFEGLIARPHGIILVTGPTGSGKTTTLYSALNALKSPRTNIITCEDPIEYELEGISQSNVNERAGLTFARQLRGILRQDPDVVLLGEIRDQETAEIAFRAALTGHLVLTTLHCNEAAGAPGRLIDMGVEPFLIASALLGTVAQRLTPRLCVHCRLAYHPDDDERALFGALGGEIVPDMQLYHAGRCARCDDHGVHGRSAIHEVMPIDNHVRRLIMERAETEPVRAAAIRAGMRPMILDGLEKATAGITTLESVHQKIGFADA